MTDMSKSRKTGYPKGIYKKRKVFKIYSREDFENSQKDNELDPLLKEQHKQEEYDDTCFLSSGCVDLINILKSII